MTLLQTLPYKNTFDHSDYRSVFIEKKIMTTKPEKIRYYFILAIIAFIKTCQFSKAFKAIELVKDSKNISDILPVWTVGEL
jgi:hypothetical protein